MLLVLTHCLRFRAYSTCTCSPYFVISQVSYSRAVQAVVLSKAGDVIVHFLLQEFGSIGRDHVSVDLVQVLRPSLCLPCLCDVLLFAIFVVSHLFRFAHDLSTNTKPHLSYRLSNMYMSNIRGEPNN